MARPDLLWRAGFVWIEDKLLEADCRLKEIASGDPEAPGLTVEDVMALVWRETDIPTVLSGRPPEKSKQIWLLAAEFLPIGVVFRRGGPWMVSSNGRILQILDLLQSEPQRINGLHSAFGESEREAPERAAFEARAHAVRMQQRVITAQRLLEGVVNALGSPQAWPSLEMGAPSLQVLEGGAE